MPRRKHLFLFALLSSITWHCTGQETVTSSAEKNEVFLTVFSIQLGNWYQSDYVGTFLNSLGYKRHFGKHALRLGLEYTDDQYYWQYESTGNLTYREGQFNLGYQYVFTDKSVQPYVAVDFFYLVAKYKSESHGGFWGYEYFMEDVNEQGIGFGPALGIKFLLPKSFSISFEGNFEFLWIQTKGTIIRNEYPNTTARNPYPVDRVDFTMLLNPLQSLSLDYSF